MKRKLSKKKQETIEKRRVTIELRKTLRDKLLRNCPKCEVIGCSRDATDMHHMKNPGLSMKGDTYENMSALCHQHHMQMDAPNWSKKRWAAEFWFGATYDQYRQYIALRRGLELKGTVPAPGLAVMAMFDMPQEVMRLAVLYARKIDLMQKMDFEEGLD